jgi:serine/threonine protein kinase
MMLEYCNGGNLQDYIEKKGRIAEKEAILIFKQILNGIAVIST